MRVHRPVQVGHRLHIDHILTSAGSRVFSQGGEELSFRAVTAHPSIVDRLDLPAGQSGRAWFHGPGNRWRRRSHRHEELEANLVVAGRASYLIDETRYELERGTLVWLHPQQNHLLADDSPDYEMWIAVWRPETVAHACASETSRPLTLARPAGLFCKRLPESTVREMERLWRQVQQVADERDRYNAILPPLLLECWAAFRETDQGSAGQAVHPAVDRAARLLRDQVKPMNVEEIAAEVGLSPSQLSRVFKQQIGLSMTAYRQRQCLQRFFDRCESDGDLSITTAALVAGFGSYPQFHRVFKQHMGYGPAEYRRTRHRGR